MKIVSGIKEYEILFEKNLDFLQSILETPFSQIVVDKNIYELYKDYFQHINEEKLFLIEAIEKNKSIETALAICEKMTDIPAKRNATLISIGGGIIQDITGFTANILYRGIKWIFAPTTLLAQCDSCIGGKTSLNYQGYKNLLGTFYPPDRIYICPQFIHTLTQEDFESGMGEVIKFNLMGGKEGIEHIREQMEKLMERNGDAVEKAIRYSLTFKKPFIEQDEFDRNERIKLNFAHTFGHAVEVVSKFEIPHGTAVAIGMIMANQVSVQRGLLREKTAKECEALLLQVIHIDYELMDKPIEELLRAMRKDKKQVSDLLTIVLMTDKAGELLIVHDASANEVREAFAYFGKLYRDVQKDNRG